MECSKIHMDTTDMDTVNAMDTRTRCRRRCISSVAMDTNRSRYCSVWGDTPWTLYTLICIFCILGLFTHQGRWFIRRDLNLTAYITLNKNVSGMLFNMVHMYVLLTLNLIKCKNSKKSQYNQYTLRYQLFSYGIVPTTNLPDVSNRQWWNTPLTTSWSAQNMRPADKVFSSSWHR